MRKYIEQQQTPHTIAIQDKEGEAFRAIHPPPERGGFLRKALLKRELSYFLINGINRLYHYRRTAMNKKTDIDVTEQAVTAHDTSLPVSTPVLSPAATQVKSAVKTAPKTPVKTGAKKLPKPAVKTKEAKEMAATVAPAAPSKKVAKPTPKVAAKAVSNPPKKVGGAVSRVKTQPVSAGKERVAPLGEVNVAVNASTTMPARDKVRKPKLVRDSFTMPEAEYAVLGEVKKACLKSGYEVKKSELLRVGVALISTMNIIALKDILAALPPLKAGRPKKA